MQARLQPNKRFIFRLSRPVNKGEPSQANPNGQEELDLYVFLLSSSALLFLSLSLSLSLCFRYPQLPDKSSNQNKAKA